MAHPEAEWPSQQNIVIFSYFTICWFHLQTQFRQNRRQKVFNWGTSCLCRGVDIRKIYM